VLHELFAKWVSEAPGFVLGYLALFGVQRLGIHGFLSSLWKLAENVAGVRSEISADFKAIRDSQAEIKQGIARIESRQSAPKEDRNSLIVNL
jgi:hypothetical protein